MAEAEWSIVLADDLEIQELNRRFRGQDRTTDVLSFPLQHGEGPSLPDQPLGDVVVSVEQAARQALDGDLEAEILRLLVHGLCHLQGMDHRRRGEARVMQRQEARLLTAAGLAGSQ